MALRLDGKKAIVAEVNEAVAGAVSAVVADYRGLTVEEMTRLRVDARARNVYVRVVRNTLARRAVAATEFECLAEACVGPTLLALSIDEPGAAARLLKDFGRKHQNLAVRALAVAGVLLGPEQLEAVSRLPTLDEARAMLMGTLLAPVTKLAQTLNEIPGRLVRTVDAVGVQKESGSARAS